MSFFFARNNRTRNAEAAAPDTPMGSENEGGIVIVEAHSSPHIPEEISLPTLRNHPAGLGIAIKSTLLSDLAIVPPVSGQYNYTASIQSSATTGSQVKRVLDSLYIQRDTMYDFLLSAEINGTVDSRRLKRSLDALSLQVETLKDLHYPQGSNENQRLQRAVRMFSLQLDDLNELYQSVQSDEKVDKDRLKRTLDGMFLQIDDVRDLNQQSIQMDRLRQSSMDSLSLCDIDNLSQIDLHDLSNPTSASPTDFHYNKYAGDQESSLDDMASVQSRAVSLQHVARAQHLSIASLPADKNDVATMYTVPHGHPFEAFEAIGSFIAEKEMAHPATKPTASSGIVAGVSTFVRGVARFFYSLCIFTTNAGSSLFSFVKNSLRLVVWSCGMTNAFCCRIYRHSRNDLHRFVTDGACNEVIVFAAGMITMGVAVAALWLVKYGTVSVFNFACVNATFAINPILEKGRLIWAMTVGEGDTASQIPIVEEVQVLTNVIVNPDPIIVTELAKPLSAFVETITVSANYVSSNHSLHDTLKYDVFPGSNFSFWTIKQALFSTHFQFVVLFVLAVATVGYQAASPKSTVPEETTAITISAISTSTQAEFQAMSQKALKAECMQRNIFPLPILALDMVRHLCEFDGIDHSFPIRNVDQYAGLTKKDLQLQLKDIGGQISGNKEDLQYRLVLAREVVYDTMSNDDLTSIATKHNISVVASLDLAQRLAEAGPMMPLVSA